MEVEDNANAEDYEMVQNLDKELDKNSANEPTLVSAAIKPQNHPASSESSSSSRPPSTTPATASNSASKDVNANGTATAKSTNNQSSSKASVSSPEEYIHIFISCCFCFKLLIY